MERRFFKRTTISILGTFIVMNTEDFQCEFEGILEDISEGGIKFVINAATSVASTDLIKVGDTVKFTAYDEYNLFGEMQEAILYGTATVLRKTVSENNVILGCSIIALSDELEEYILNKQTSIYMKALDIDV